MLIHGGIVLYVSLCPVRYHYLSSDSHAPTGHVIRNLTDLGTGPESCMYVWGLSIYERSLAVYKGVEKSVYKYELIC